MLDRLASWLMRVIAAAIVWFDHQPGWIQLLIVVVVIAAVVALTHCDELRRARDWAEFRAWQERRRRAARLRSGTIPSGGDAFFWVRYDPPPEGVARPIVRARGLTIGERPGLLRRFAALLRHLGVRWI